MAKEPKTLGDLFHDTLKDIYFAEKKLACSTNCPPGARALLATMETLNISW